MNSSQRRKAKREHPHRVSLLVNGNERYYAFDLRVDAAIKWCKKKCTGSYVVDAKTANAVFTFANEKDAIIFGLKVL
jgi:hypothetical protein